ncbi:MAG: hypothetical protein ACRDRK_24960 [Pseudonocardia sp.]
MNLESADRACHDLLVQLAGRLPDQLLWRLRDWLATERSTHPPRSAISAILPRELLRHRVGLTNRERDLLGVAVGGWDTPRRLLDAVLPIHVSHELGFTFGPDPEAADLAALSTLAVVRGHPGCSELRLARRTDGRRDQRVVLVHGADRPWVLAGTLQRVLRAHGDRTPCVEVLPSGIELLRYHQAAVAASVSLWRIDAVSARELVGT